MLTISKSMQDMSVSEQPPALAEGSLNSVDPTSAAPLPASPSHAQSQRSHATTASRKSTGRSRKKAPKASKLARQQALAARPALPKPEGPYPPCPRCSAGPESVKFCYYNNHNVRSAAMLMFRDMAFGIADVSSAASLGI
jgi:hypothetical protein